MVSPRFRDFPVKTYLTASGISLTRSNASKTPPRITAKRKYKGKINNKEATVNLERIAIPFQLGVESPGLVVIRAFQQHPACVSVFEQ